MTHLRILQSDSAIEQVSSAVIAKLYELATSGDLDLTSDLLGRLHTTGTYLKYIDELTTEYLNLYITADRPYIMLKDPEITRALATLYGDGTGITQTLVDSIKSSITYFSQLGATASNIVTTEDLALFTNITALNTLLFLGSTNLKTLDLTNITTLYYNLCYDCTSLTEIKNSDNVTLIQANAFRGCSNLTGVLLFPNLLDVTGSSRVFAGCEKITGFVAPKLTSLTERFFEGCSSLTGDLVFKRVTYIGGATFLGCSSGLWIFLEDIQQFSYNVFANASSDINLIINNTTVPTVDNNTFTVNVNIYVPDSAVSTYRSTLTQYSSNLNKIKPISELPAAKLAIVNAS